MELSCSSSPLAIHSQINLRPQPYRRVYLHNHPRNVASLWPNCYSSSSSCVGSNTASTSSSSSSSYFGISVLCKARISKLPKLSKSNGTFYVTCGVFEKFTERAVKAVMFSQREAKALGAEMVFTQHLLLGLVVEDRGSGGFLDSGITVDEARQVVKRIWHSNSDSDHGDSAPNENAQGAEVAEVASATDVPFSPSTKRVFEAAVEYSRTMGYNFIAPEHIAIGLFTVDDGSASQVLKRLGANVNHLAAVAITRLEGELAKDGRVPPAALKRSRENSTAGKTALAKSSPRAGDKRKTALDQFCVDLTALASEGRIDPVIGREAEVHRVVQILCRRTKNNAILLGEAGVGKTAIAEGLAIKIAEGNIPFNLLTKRIMSLDIGLLIAGAKERGELEDRVTTLIKEIKKSALQAMSLFLLMRSTHLLVLGQ